MSQFKKHPMSVPWTDEEVKFVAKNGSQGITWLVGHMNRSIYSIQRIAFIHKISLKNGKRKPPPKPKKKSVYKSQHTDDDLIQEEVKFMQQHMWKPQQEKSNEKNI